jgi:predicted Zn-dependent protease
MNAGWTSKISRTGLLGLLLTIAGTLVAADDTFEPNYANHMLTPYQGSGIAPKLVAFRHHFPLKVVVLEDGVFFNERYFERVKEACLAWTNATKNVRQGGVTLTCIAAEDPTGADVVFKFGTTQESFGFEGFTSEFGTWALIRLSARDTTNQPVSEARLRRVAMHEFGHALGIWGHSPNPKDIMSLDDRTTEVSTADVNTLLIAYANEPATATTISAP